MNNVTVYGVIYLTWFTKGMSEIARNKNLVKWEKVAQHNNEEGAEK